MTPALNDWPDEEEFQRFLSRASDEARYKEFSSCLLDKARYLEDICHLCWDLCKTDQERLQKRMDEINLSSMKQVMALKAQLGRGGGDLDKDGLIEFYEPLRYLQDTTKDLVLNIIGDKVEQLVDGKAPPSLVKAVAKTRESESGEWQERCKVAEERAEAAEANAAFLQAQLRDVESQVERMQKVARTREADLRASKEREKALQKHVDELAADLAATRTHVKQLEDEKAQLEREMAEFEQKMKVLEQKIQSLEQELAEAKAAYDQVVAELNQAKQEIHRLQRQCEELEQRAREAEAKLLEAKAEIQSLKAECQKLQDKVAVAEARAKKAEAEAAELRAELARRNNTRTFGTQTSMKGEHIVEQKEENKRLKGMLEELRMKVSDLMTELRKRGLGKEAKEMMGQVGLDTLLKADSCFQRLYDDAMDRIHRMDKLRERIMEERNNGGAHLARFVPTPQMMEKAIENSTIENDVRAQENRCVVERELVQANVPTFGIAFTLPQLPGATPPNNMASTIAAQVEWVDHQKRGSISIDRSMSKTGRQYSALPSVFNPAMRSRQGF